MWAFLVSLLAVTLNFSRYFGRRPAVLRSSITCRCLLSASLVLLLSALGCSGTGSEADSGKSDTSAGDNGSAVSEEPSSESDSVKSDTSTGDKGSAVSEEPLAKLVNVNQLAGLSEKDAEQHLGRPLERYGTDYTNPSWSNPSRSIPSVSCVYACGAAQVKLRFIEGGARWITVYFEEPRPRNLREALEAIGLKYESPTVKTSLLALWNQLGSFYEVRAFPHNTWGQGVSYILATTEVKYE